MRVKLIQPKMIKRPMDTELKLRMSPHLGLLTIANIIRDKCEVSIENENINDLDFTDVADIVGITITVDVLPRAIEIAKKFKEKGSIIVAGGIHVTTAPSSIPKEIFDVICIGHGETTWPKIINDYNNNTLKSSYTSTPIKGSDIVSPAYDMINMDDYLYCNIVYTSRSCPFRCDFCYNSSGNHQFLNREIDDVIQDIKYLNTKHIMFIDDNFIGNPNWTKSFLEKIMPLGLKWNAAVSSNILNYPDLLDLMKESGCKSLFIGFESINENSISSVNKIQNNIREYEHLIEELHNRDIMINGSFVFGLDGDSLSTFKNTVDWIVKQKIETITSHILTPYPGTKFYDRILSSNRITDFNLSKYNTASVVFEPLGMTKDELYNGYIGVYKELYSFKNIIKRMPKRGFQVFPYLTFNFLYRKYGKFTEFFCNIISYRNVGKIAQLLSRYV